MTERKCQGRVVKVKDKSAIDFAMSEPDLMQYQAIKEVDIVQG